MMLKVLNVISGGLKKDGITSVEYEYARIIKELRLDERAQIDFVAIDGLSDKRIEDKFRDIGVNVYELPNRKKDVIKYFFELKKLLKREKYDVILAQGSSALLTIEMLAAKCAGVPVRIVKSRNTKCSQVKLDKMLRPLFYRCYTDAFACGNDAGRWLFGERSFYILPNGKDFSVFKYSEEKRSEVRKRFKLEDKIVVGHVGNMNAQKNHIFLLKIFAALKEKMPNTILYLMGDGALHDELVKTTKELGIDNDVIFAGSVEDVNVRLLAMDIMVFPSLYEGLPNVVLEWQAEGLPCLMSDVITEECIKSDFVYRLPLSDGETVWADKIKEIYEIPFDRNKASEEATRNLKGAGYDIRDNARTLVDKYEELVQKRRGRKNDSGSYQIKTKK